MANLALWPAYADDAGDGQSGTAITKAFLDSIKTAIREEVYSAANPLITPEDIINEVVTARGTTASLNARLSTVIAADGSFIVPTGAVTQAVAQTFQGNKNWVYNDTFLLWPSVDSLTIPAGGGPSGWVLTGDAATVEQAGVGCTDASNAKVGRFWAKVIRNGADAALTQRILSTTAVGIIPELKTNLKVSIGAWVKCAAADRARLWVDDGVSVTRSSYHTGSGDWEFLTISLTLAPTMSYLDLSLALEGSDGYGGISGPTLIWSDLGVSRWAPGTICRGIIKETFPGVLAAATDQRRIQVPCPCLVTYVQLRCGTAPVGANIVVDVNTYRAAGGGSWNSMFQAGDRPTIVAADNYGGHATTRDPTSVATVAGAYTNACVRPFWGGVGTTVPPDHAEISIDIDTVGAGGTEGSDLDVYLHVIGFPARDIEHFADYDDI